MFRLVRFGLLVALTVLLGLAGCGGEAEDPNPSTATDQPSSDPDVGVGVPSGGQDIPADEVIVEVMIVGGVVTPAENEVHVPVGSTVRLLVTSGIEDEAHVHGYELTVTLPPGEQAELEFVADIPGVFVVESHETGMQLCLLTVE